MADYQQYDFSGGMDETTSPLLLEPNTLTSLVNADLSHHGAIKKAKGKTRMVAASLGASKVLGIQRFVRKGAGTEFLVIAHGTTAQRLNTANNTWVSIKTGLTAQDTQFITAFNDWLYAFNGTDNPWMWDGTNSYNIAITAPSVTPTFSANIVGSLHEGREYSIKYSFYSTALGRETNASTVSATRTTTADKGIRWSVTGSADARVDKIRVYRTSGNVGGAWYYEGEITNTGAVAHVYDSTIADILLQGTSAPSSHNAPPIAKYACYHMGRLFLAGVSGSKHSVYYSKPSPSHEYFPLAYYINVPSGEAVTGMLSMLTNLYVFTENTISVISTPQTGDPVSSWSIHQVEGKRGCVANRSLIGIDGMMFFLSTDGVYAFDGRMTRKLFGIDYDEIHWDYAPGAAGIYHDGRYLLSVPTGTSTVNNLTYELTLDGLSWVKHNNKSATCYEHWDGLVAGDPSAGLVWKLFNGDENDGSAFTVTAITRPYVFASYPMYKEYDKLHLLVDATKDDEIDLILHQDGNDTSATLTIDVDDLYRFPQQIHRSKTLQIELAHTSKNSFTWKGLAVEYRPWAKK